MSRPLKPLVRFTAYSDVFMSTYRVLDSASSIPLRLDNVRSSVESAYVFVSPTESDTLRIMVKDVHSPADSLASARILAYAFTGSTDNVEFSHLKFGSLVYSVPFTPKG